MPEIEVGIDSIEIGVAGRLLVVEQHRQLPSAMKIYEKTSPSQLGQDEVHRTEISCHEAVPLASQRGDIVVLERERVTGGFGLPGIGNDRPASVCWVTAQL